MLLQGLLEERLDGFLAGSPLRCRVQRADTDHHQAAHNGMEHFDGNDTRQIGASLEGGQRQCEARNMSCAGLQITA